MDLSAFATYIPLGVLGLVRWASWLIRRVPASLYRPARTGHFEPLTIVVPVYQEDPARLPPGARVLAGQRRPRGHLRDRRDGHGLPAHRQGVPGAGHPHRRARQARRPAPGLGGGPDAAGRPGRLRHHLGRGRGRAGLRAVRRPPGRRGRHQAERGRPAHRLGAPQRHVPGLPLLRRDRLPDGGRPGRVLPLGPDGRLPPVAAAAPLGAVHERDASSASPACPATTSG